MISTKHLIYLTALGAFGALSGIDTALSQTLQLSTGTNSGSGVLGTGINVGTSTPGTGILGTGVVVDTTGASGGVLGTGATVGTTNPGSGVLGTGVTVGTTDPTTGVLGTGITVGTTNPGSGVLGTGVTIGTSPTTGVLGTGVTVGTTNPGGGVLGTGVTVGTNPTAGVGGTGTTVGIGGTGDGTGTNAGGAGTGTAFDASALTLRLSRLEQDVANIPLRGTDTAGRGVPVTTGADAIAVGAGASAGGNNATALGTAANAAGTNATALGHAASATQDNAVAIGANARTTRANQVAIGAGGSTYTMAGLPSAASRATQSGATQFVTTDAAGNLATSGYGPGNLAAMEGRLGTVEANVSRLQRDMRGAYQGTALALALTGAVLPEGKTFAVSANFGAYHGETGFGASGIARVSDNVFVSGGVGVGTSGQSNVAGRGGVTVAW